MLKPYIYFVISIIGILSIFQLKFVKDSVIASTIYCSILTSFKIQISLSNEHLGLLPFVFQSFITFESTMRTPHLLDGLQTCAITTPCAGTSFSKA